MLCDNCHERDAVVHLTQIENNAVLAAPPVRAVRRGARGGDDGGRGRSIRWANSCTRSSADAAGRAIPRSGARSADARWRDFRATGRLGCAHCYATFESSMRELLRRVHGSSQHVGENYQVPQSEAVERTAKLARTARAAPPRHRDRAVRARGRSARPDPGAGMTSICRCSRTGAWGGWTPRASTPTSCCPRGCGWRGTWRGSRSRAGPATGSGCACCRRCEAAVQEVALLRGSRFSGWTRCRRWTGCCCTNGTWSARSWRDWTSRIRCAAGRPWSWGTSRA